MTDRHNAARLWQNPLVLGAALVLITGVAMISQRFTPSGRLEAQLEKLEDELLQRIKIRRAIEAKMVADLPEQAQLDRLKETLLCEVEQYEGELKTWGDQIGAFWDRSKGVFSDREQFFLARREKLARGLLTELRLSKEFKARVKTLAKKPPYPDSFWLGGAIR